MSEVIMYSAVRFKFSKSFKNTTEMYNYIKGILGEPEGVEYKKNWDSTNKRFITTEEVNYISYPKEKGNYVLVQDYNKGYWFLDYLLDTPSENYYDCDISISLSELNKIYNKTKEKFKGYLEEECKVKVYEWYTGCDMPVEF